MGIVSRSRVTARGGVRTSSTPRRTTTPSIVAVSPSSRSASSTRTSVTSPSPAITASAPASRYIAGWSVASEPATSTGMPRVRAAAIMTRAACSHPQQAHLAQVVEAVLVDHCHARGGGHRARRSIPARTRRASRRTAPRCSRPRARMRQHRAHPAARKDGAPAQSAGSKRRKYACPIRTSMLMVTMTAPQALPSARRAGRPLRADTR